MDENNGTRTLREQLFGNWDRIYAFISIAVSIVMAVFSLYLAKYPFQITPLLVVRDLVIVFILIGFIVFLMHKYIRGDEARKRADENHQLEIAQFNTLLENHRKYIQKQFYNSFEIVHDSISELFKHYKSVLSRSAELQVTKGQFDIFEKMCLSITTQVKDSFKEYFEYQGIDVGDDIAVAVKLVLSSATILRLYEKRLDDNERLLLSNSHNDWAITVYRDNDTFRKKQREVGLKMYDVQKNTAFQNIMNVHNHSFVCNDLQRQSGYNNENPDWIRQYNSTIVVPIALDDMNQHIVFGFLAVDSGNEKGQALYNDKECVHILRHAADMLCSYFLAAVLHYFVEN